MFCRIFLFVIISDTILVAFSERNYDNGLLNTEEKGTTNVNYRKVGNEQTVVQRILNSWVSLMKKKSKDNVLMLDPNEQHRKTKSVLPWLAPPERLRERAFDDKPLSTNLKQVQNQEDSDFFTPEHVVLRPWWMQSPLEFSNTEIEKVLSTTEPQKIILLKKENEKQTITLSQLAANIENSHWNTVQEKNKQLMPMKPISEPLVKNYMIDNKDVPIFEGKKHQLPITENVLQIEKDFINPSTPQTAEITKKLNSKLTNNPSKQKIHTIEAKNVNTQLTTATQESIFKNWGLILFDSKNKLFEEEHDQLENELHKNKKQSEATLQALESVEVDDDRNKALRNKVETWFDKLRSRRELAKLGLSSEIKNIARLRNKIQSVLAEFQAYRAQERQLSERPHAACYPGMSKWRRQLLNQYSMPKAVDYRRLLSLWQNELRRQLQIKWNRRPLVEISPGAFKTDIYVNPPDDLAKHMQKLLELKKRQEERNKDLNAGREDAV